MARPRMKQPVLSLAALLLLLLPSQVFAQVEIDLATDPVALTVWGSVSGGAGRQAELGDWNGDGIQDLAVSEPFWRDPGSGALGRVAIYFGPFNFPEVHDLLTEIPPVAIQIEVHAAGSVRAPKGIHV